MKTTTRLLLILLSIIIFNGCSKKVYLKCSTPPVEEPIYNNSKKGTPKALASRFKTNLAKKDRYIRELEKANRVCK
jgi:uncharacterized lipoprotein YajG